jgi:predicted ChrR family anti-sigma factor
MGLGCQDTTARLTDYSEGALPWNERLFVSLHLKRCHRCRGLLADLTALPILVRKSEMPVLDLAPLAARALEGALKALGRPRLMDPSPVPEAVRSLLSAGADLPLQLMAQAHEAMFQGGSSRQEPYLPASILEQLPRPETWKWKPSGQARRALLAVDPKGGQRLSILYAPPKCQFPGHVHRGTESLLILEGEMEDGGRCLGNGDWVHLEEGSSHAPYVFEEGCWCLVRDEGSIGFKGAFGWLRQLVA